MDLRGWKRACAFGAVLALGLGGCALVSVSRVSVDSTGTQANSHGFSPSISADGRYVAFYSRASNLVAGDTNGTDDVFVRDTVTGTTTRASVDGSGTQANSDSVYPSISADGRYVAFRSGATNLVADDTNGSEDVFVRDTVAGTTTRVSVDGSGTQANNRSVSLSISADGRYVAFDSDASNLVAGDTNGRGDVFVRDSVTGTTSRVSVDSSGTQANIHSVSPSISADGRSVAFTSGATNLVAGDTNDANDVFVRDTVAGTTTRVNVDGSGIQANSHGFGPSISADGRYVAFYSGASNLVAGDTNGANDVFVRDTVAGTTARVSVDGIGTQANGPSLNPAISADGRYVAFYSGASNLVGGDTNGAGDVFVRDAVTGTTTRVSVDGIGTQANSSSGSDPSISADGRSVAFPSDATNLVGGDTNFVGDVFVRSNPQPAVIGVSPAALTRGTTTPVTVSGWGFIDGAVLDVSRDGVTLADVTVVSPTQITADITLTPTASLGKRNVLVTLPGTGAGPATGATAVCINCVTVN